MAEVTARDFNRDVSAAKRAASKGPVIITDRGEPSHVLLSIEEYHRLLADERSIVDWLSTDNDIDLEGGRVNVELQVPEL